MSALAAVMMILPCTATARTDSGRSSGGMSGVPSAVAGRRPDEIGLWPGFGYSPGVSFFACSPWAARRACASVSPFTGCNCSRSILLRT